MIDLERRVTMDADMLNSYWEFPDKFGAQRGPLGRVGPLLRDVEHPDILRGSRLLSKGAFHGPQSGSYLTRKGRP